MKRGLRYTWPRTETRIYQEPKNLVRHGLATASVETTGKRRRTVYSITTEGHRELARWLGQQSAPPQFQSEALLRATFADAGTRDALLATFGDYGRRAAPFAGNWGSKPMTTNAPAGPFRSAYISSR
jgi:PadR family transcriptional regulator AphA